MPAVRTVMIDSPTGQLQYRPSRPGSGANVIVTALDGSSPSQEIAVYGFAGIVRVNHSRVDRSGTITLGGTAQTLMAENLVRAGFLIQNQSEGDLWINELGVAAATHTSILIPGGAYYVTEEGAVPVTTISIFGATTGLQFMSREW